MKLAKLLDEMKSKVAMKTKTAKPTPGTAKAGSAPALHGIQSILVPIDFSAPSKKALAYAVSFAEQFGARLTLLNVVEPVAMPDFATSFPLAMENDKVMVECKRELDRVVKTAGISPKRIEKTLVRFGHSYHEIADAARTLKVDLIIIATHGYTGLKHALLGSTTDRKSVV